VLSGKECAEMNHEEELIKAFFVPTKRERYLEIAANPKKRKKFLLERSRFKALNPRYCFAVPKVEHTVEQIAAFLTRKGAPPSCWVTSENSDIDGKEMPLRQALKEVIGYPMGTFISCVPGQLAYFEDEDDRWILEVMDSTDN
jgi:hypothetical protein